MKRLTQQLATKRIIEELPHLLRSDIDEIQKAIDELKKARSGNRTSCKPTKDHDQIVRAFNKLTRKG